MRTWQWGGIVVVLVLQACGNSDPLGAGTVAAEVYPQSYQCQPQQDGGQVASAGVVHAQVSTCEGRVLPRARMPQTVAPVSRQPTMAHRWWGNVTFFGEHAVADPEGIGYLTPDPLMARITQRGMRLMGIPAGLRVPGDGVTYAPPEPLKEVFDGVALGNSQFDQLDAFVRDYSDGSVTLEWRSGHRPVMAATFVQGSPYLFLSVYQGALQLRTLAPSGAQKGIFYRQDDTLGVWTDVAGRRNHVLLTGHGDTEFINTRSAQVTARSQTSHFTLTWLPVADGAPSSAMIRDFLAHARQPVDEVRVDYRVNPKDYRVTVSHQYRYRGRPVPTLVGLSPLQWKRSTQPLTDYRIRSARGWLRFAATAGFDYALPSVGVLPGLSAGLGDADRDTLRALVLAFVSRDPASWTAATDTYFAGRHYGKVAELALIARQVGLTREADQLLEWLKAELEDWFTADSGERARYFVLDSRWNTVLGVRESFGAHQALNDHHFHYGYFVRAAAEICRVDASWCGRERWGPMVELLIRDYAAGRNDPQFPYLRHFDPAQGFSSASGATNYRLGNNNESTSEAALAYGAIVLYGLVTDQPELVERGVYLHASTAASFWEYWSDIDDDRQRPEPYPWLHAWQTLGHLRSDHDDLTADYPAAVALESSEGTTYLAYNFDSVERVVSFSNGVTLTVAPGAFEVRKVPHDGG